MDAEKDKETGATEPMEDMDCFFEKKGATAHHLLLEYSDLEFLNF
jgi:hypothetical protein